MAKTRLGQIDYRLGFPKPKQGYKLVRDFPMLTLVDTQ